MVGKTKALTLKAPTGLTISGVAKTTARASWNKVAGATGYNVILNGKPHGETDGAAYTVRGLKPNTTYRVNVKADTANQAPGPSSVTKTFKTKK